ncbi:MAG TPA: tetratricopeptide repeat protein [Vicinamibacterales bacterium]|nr:tetratricopeptide repeat protein [Vicinamibacterales bacterium]
MLPTPDTSAAALNARIGELESRVHRQPGDIASAVGLSEALLRHARASNDVRAANRAAAVLEDVLKSDPAQYDALKMLGAILLSQHRFRDALAVARRARNLRPDDPWNFGVMGDALVELGDYDEALAAFDTLMAMRPGPTAYARTAYARELRGNLRGALEAMRLALQSTASQDAEAQAWYSAQVGELYLRLGNFAAAEQAYRRSAFVFPEYPHAMIGLGKVKAARGDRAGALAVYRDQFHRTPSLDLAARIGDLYRAEGNAAEAERYYRLAEDFAGPGIAQTEAHLALFLADHDRKLDEAVRIAEAVARVRHDIFTEDALAWSYFKVGRIDEALAASERAIRTGTRDTEIIRRAEHIRAVSQQRAQSRPLTRTGARPSH